MTEAGRVLADEAMVAEAIWRVGSGVDGPVPERFVMHVYPDTLVKMTRAAIRAIIAREVAAAEPSDEALRKFENAASLFSQLRTTVAARFEGLCERELWLSINAAFDKLEAARALLEGSKP